MGNKASKMNERYGNYEKSFDRLEKDTQRVKTQLIVRGRTRSHLRFWSSLLIAGAVAVAATIIYQIQQQPPGTFTYQQHFQRTAAAVSVPAVAVLLHWLAALWMDLQQRRDTRKLQRLEAAQKTMLKELKEMINYDKVKALIDKFDPEARASHAALLQQGQAMGRQMGGPPGRGGPQNARAGGGPQAQMPAMLVKGSGQVASAAALAVAGAGKALMPLVDKLAATLISDNPMLLEDLRQAQSQMQVAQERAMGAVQESLGLKYENLDLKMRLVELESQLKVEPSYDLEGLEEQKQQLYQQTQQAAWQQEIQQQYLQQPPLDGAVLGGQQVLTQGSGSGNFGARGSGDDVQGVVNRSSSGELRHRGGGSKASLSSGQLQGSTPPGTPMSEKL